MATGSITITPSKVWNEIDGETLDLAKLNQTANPTARVDANTIGRRELITAFTEEVDGVIAGLATEQTVRADGDEALASFSRIITASAPNRWANFILQSSDLTVSPWSLFNIGASSVAPTVTAGFTGPDGGDAWRLVADAGANASLHISSLNQTVSGMADPRTQVTALWLKSNTASSQTVRVQRDGGVASNVTVTTDWQRFVFTDSISSEATSAFYVGAYPSLGTDIAIDVLIANVQMTDTSEAGPFIPTGASAIGSIAATITEEATTRATSDGYLSGSYVVRVDANGNQAGLAITAISDPSGWATTSEVSITASVFKVADGTTKVVPFQITGTKARFTTDVEIDGSLMVSSTIAASALNVETLSAITADLGTVTAGTIDIGSGSSHAVIDEDRLAYGNLGASMDAFIVQSDGSNVGARLVSEASSIGLSCDSDRAQIYLFASPDSSSAGRIILDTNISDRPEIQWGIEGVGMDTNLYRSAADVLKTDDKLITAIGLGVGNSAAATTLGSVTKKMEVFDASGTSLGYVPIYDAIT